ncbi:response regulator [Lacimicrobium alkaliphilum]|uniref:response regulator n=1 Tax=Lacimicrobium alkaliphilum TaxID=1526571 RepID=UPI0009E9829C|nr:response regulator [Lacimicrobium alkaliphilum]
MSAKVLTIEDNPDNLALMVYILEAFEFEVETATDGVSGLEAASRVRPDLILCDIQMPEMDGYEVIRHLKNDDKLAHIPVIAVTAFAMEVDGQKIQQAGFDGYITKPIEPESFVEQIQAFLSPATTPSPKVSFTARESTPTSWKKVILVVDDQPVNLELATSLLEHYGYRVLRAQGMKKAQMILRDRVPDLILSDVCMDDGNGYDLIRAVKAEPALQEVPFVF